MITQQTVLKGVQAAISPESIQVVWVHYSADPAKDPDTKEGAKWLDTELQGYKGTTDPRWQQEMEINFEAESPGAYYAEEMANARTEGRIKHVEHVPGIPVDTWWDLGMDDSSAIWFSQSVGREIHLLSYYEDANVGLLHYAKVLDRKAEEGNWMYGKHGGPHDIQVRELGPGKSRLEQAKRLTDPITGRVYSINFDIVKKPDRKEDGIEAVRSILPKCYFDAVGCAHGIKALSNYRKGYDERKRVYGVTPIHDWACLAGNTKIRTLNGWQRIKDLEGKSFYVWAYDFEQKRLRPAQTNRCWKAKKVNTTVLVHLDHRHFIQCTPDHLFLLRNGSWKQAIDLVNGEALMPFYEKLDRGYPKIHLTDGSIKVIKIEVINNSPIDVYDIEVPRYHNFVAEGVIVHNSHGADAFQTLALGHGVQRYSWLEEAFG